MTTNKLQANEDYKAPSVKQKRSEKVPTTKYNAVFKCNFANKITTHTNIHTYI